MSNFLLILNFMEKYWKFQEIKHADAHSLWRIMPTVNVYNTKSSLLELKAVYSGRPTATIHSYSREFCKINIYNLKFNLHVTKYRLSNTTRLTHRLLICLNLLLIKPQSLRYMKWSIHSFCTTDNKVFYNSECISKFVKTPLKIERFDYIKIFFWGGGFS